MRESEAFGPWLGRQLRRRGLTQAELAQVLGVTRAAVSAWITGRAEPREDKKRAIAAALGTDEATVHNRTVDAEASLPVRWYHRPAHADGGREFGNAAAFAFHADLTVLAREAGQNSLDERHDTRRPVRVRHSLHELTGESMRSFLGALQWESLEPHYEAAAMQQQKVGRALAEGLREMRESQSLRLLRIDDYNASGLTGPDYGDGRFAAVVRRQLDSHKASGRAAGSYGLGKATLWAASRLGLVLINSTLSEPHEGRTTRRVIGRLDLPWRTVEGQAFAGPAWLGEPETEPEHAGVSRSWWADSSLTGPLHLERENQDPGTSFLVVGAHDASGDAEGLEDMHDKLVRALADSFWAAMASGGGAPPLMEASVTTLRNGTVVVPEQRVDPEVHQPGRTRALRAHLDGRTVDRLTGPDQVARVDVSLVVPPLRGEPGRAGTEHRAVLLVTPADDRDREYNRIVCMRGNRMTVTARRVTDLPPGADPFQAVLLAGHATGAGTSDVEAAEAFLRASEPPEHNDWNRTEELATAYARGARTRIEQFRREMAESVRRTVGRRAEKREGGPAVLRELLRPEAGTPRGRRVEGHPTVRQVTGRVDENGAWVVRVDVRLPFRDDPWRMSPVAKFDVRSGIRPTVPWARIVPGSNCTFEDEVLRFASGARRASFDGTTDPTGHPVAAHLTRLIVDLQKPGGALA